jgi:(E)-4-hydroxy-3-methylbut-2-enyl-diphosphate synthase
MGNPSDSRSFDHDFRILYSSAFLSLETPPEKPFEIVVDNPQHLRLGEITQLPETAVLWSISPTLLDVGLYRYLAAWLAGLGRKDLIVLRGETDGSLKTAVYHAARLGSLLCDGIGDMIHITGPGFNNAVNLAYDILQAAGARRSKTEFISCPGCGRTLFDLEKTAGRIRSLTGHLGDVAIGIMGCIVNGPGEMGDADFGYVGGAPGKVNLYVGRKCVRKNIPEAEAPAALVELIKSSDKWQDPKNRPNNE